MTTPQNPDPNGPPDPYGYPPPGGYPQTGGQPASYPPPGQPGSYPPPGQPGSYPPPDAYPPPGQPGSYPPPDAYPPPGGYPQTGGQPASYPPPGQPGAYPPPPGSVGGPGMPGGPGEPPKKSNTPRIIMAVVVVVVVVVAIVLYFVSRGSDPDYAEVGDCIKYTSQTDVSVVDCSSDGAQYKVQKRVDGTSSEDACRSVADSDVSLYTEAGNDKQYTLCVSLVLHEGDCMSADFQTVACSDPAASYEVTEIIEGSTDADDCPAGSQGRAYQADKRVACVARPS